MQRLRRLRLLLRKNRDAELREEMQTHREMLAADRGLSQPEAERAFGNDLLLRERTRDVLGWRWAEDFGRDLTLALRQMRRAPGFTILAVVILALGIGANTAVFSLADAVLLRGLPVQDPGGLVLFRWSGEQYFGSSNEGPAEYVFSYPAFLRFRARATDLSGIFGSVPLGFSPQNTAVSASGHPELADGAMVTGGFFPGLGVKPLLGRTLTDADQAPGATPVAVISYAYWTRRFTRDPAILSRSVTIDGLAYNIVGVMPPVFHGVHPLQSFDLWVPMLERPGLAPYGVPGDGRFLEAKNRIWMGIMGRLRPGVTRAAAQAQLDSIFRQYMASAVNEVGASPHPSLRDFPHLELRAGTHGMSGLAQAVARPLLLMMLLAGLTLLVACANLAALLLARTSTRRKEIGVRQAMGASRGRLIRHALAETVLLAICGAGLGLLVAEVTIRALARQISAGFGLNVNPALNSEVLAFATLTAVAAGILIGILPALRAARVDIARTLASNGTGLGGGVTRLGTGRGLLVAQVAVSLVLLVTAGLFVRTLYNLQTEDFGFSTSHMLLFSVDPGQIGYHGQRTKTFYATLQSELAHVPGVRAATLAMATPLSGSGSSSPGKVPGLKQQPPARSVRWNLVGPDYLRTNGIPLRLGRGIGAHDTLKSPPVAVINQLTAERFFGHSNPIGHQFDLAGTAWTVVGVMRNTEFGRPSDPIRAQAILPYRQFPGVVPMQVELRTYAQPETVLREVQTVVHRLDAGLPLGDVRTEAGEAAQGTTGQRIMAWLASCLGLFGVALTAVGLGGTMAFLAARRTGEIGIRMALGARPSAVLWLVLAQGMRMAALGIALGLAGALGLTRFLSSQLYGVEPYDPLTFAAVAALLVAVTLAACYVPARRAARTDPMVALRHE